MRRTATTHVFYPMRSRPRWTATAGLVLGLLLAGCGGGGDAGSGATDSAAQGSAVQESSAPDDSAATTADGGDSTTGGDGCDLISDDVAAQILGIEIVRREPNVDAATGGISCLKGTERVTDLTQAYYVSVSNTPGGAVFLDQAIGQADYEPVPGVGDRAEFLASAGSLIIAAGADLVTVQVVQAGVPGNLEDCITVAQDVLANR